MFKGLLLFFCSIWLLLMRSSQCYDAPKDETMTSYDYQLESLPMDVKEKVMAPLTGKHYRLSPFHVSY